MTRKRYRYFGGAYLLALLFIWLGVTLTSGRGEQTAVASAVPDPADVPPDVQIVEITEKEWELAPANLSLTAGEIQFVLMNKGTKVHDFQVSREGFDKKSKRVGVNKSRIFKVTLEPGEYVYFCPISGHRSKGMEGALTVKKPCCEA